MKIENGILLSVNETDVSPDGVLHIPNGVTSIAEGAGNNLKNLKELHLPETIKKLDKQVFCNNSSLIIVDLGRGITDISLFSFKNCPNITKVYLTKSSDCTLQWACAACQRLKTLIAYDSNGNKERHNILSHNGNKFYVTDSKKINNITVSKLSYLYRLADKVQNKNISDRIYVRKKDDSYSFISMNFDLASAYFHQYELMQEFEREIRRYNIINDFKEIQEEYQDILRHALRNQTDPYKTKDTPKDRKIIRNYIQNTAKYLEYLKLFDEKYPRTEKRLDELTEIDFDTLVKIITPIDKKQTNQSCTRWLKRHPVTPAEMNSIVRAGYKNPGAFPYSWLKKIPENRRSDVTRQLHEIFKKATISMYSPDYTEVQELLHLDILEKLSKDISKILKQPVEIAYLGSGNFSKTYTIQIPGDDKYVWKIYHCDIDGQTPQTHYHNTELQNSFLLGGKRYYGKTKFRKISTAGISNQRGEIYLIYPYTDEEVTRKYIFKEFVSTCRYKLTDRNINNILGHTLIDMGAIEINVPRWSQPRYVSKIMNTILYQSWNDLGYLLNNYTSSQIKMAISFIDGRVSVNSLKYNTIQAKIEYLKRGAKIR